MPLVPFSVHLDSFVQKMLWVRDAQPVKLLSAKADRFGLKLDPLFDRPAQRFEGLWLLQDGPLRIRVSEECPQSRLGGSRYPRSRACDIARVEPHQIHLGQRIHQTDHHL